MARLTVLGVVDDFAMLMAINEAGESIAEPTKPQLTAMLAGLGHGNAFLIVERGDDTPGDWYVQALLFVDHGIYQLEYRDGVAEKHYQTIADTPDQVINAMLGWAYGRPGWKDPFEWRAMDQPAGNPLRLAARWFKRRWRGGPLHAGRAGEGG